eukprot:5008480-Pyramimonas_sp.AAC.2
MSVYPPAGLFEGMEGGDPGTPTIVGPPADIVRANVPQNPEERWAQLQDDCNTSVALSVMLLVKRHLRTIYGLTDVRIQVRNKFSSIESSRPRDVLGCE